MAKNLPSSSAPRAAEELDLAPNEVESTASDSPPEGLIKMVKLGHAPLHVHPTTVQSHKGAGWIQSEE